MHKRKIDKSDYDKIKQAVSQMRASGLYRDEQLKESLHLFKGHTVVGLFDDNDQLIAWRVLDDERNVLSAIGGIRVSGSPQAAPPYGGQHASYGGYATRPEPGHGGYANESTGYAGYGTGSELEHDGYGAPASQHGGYASGYARDGYPDNGHEYDREEQPKKKGKAGTVIAVLFSVLIIAGLGFCGFLIWTGQFKLPSLPFLPQETQKQSSDPDYESYTQAAPSDMAHIVIVPGDTPSEIRTKLLQSGFVSAAKDFSSEVSSSNAAERIQAGDYIVLGSEGAAALVKRMTIGDLVPDGVIGVNIGDDITKIASTIDAARAPFSGQDFLNEARNVPAFWFDYRMLSDVPADLPSLEGYFDEGEYNLNACANANEAVRMMLAVSEARFERSGIQPREWFNTLVKASLIEKEAFFDEDRKLIASVIENRLVANEPLQIDATIKYATGSTDARVMYEDTEVNSPYNTYNRPGLPIGPICSGISDVNIDAALHPEHTDYFYYVLRDKEGHHVFSSTPEEFARDKQQYLDLFGYDSY